MLLGIPFSYRAVIRAAHYNRVGYRVQRVDPMDVANQRCFHASFVIPDADQAVFVASIYLRHMKKETSHKPPNSLSIELFHCHFANTFGLRAAPYRIPTFPAVQERLRDWPLYVHATCDFLIFEVPDTDRLISVTGYQVFVTNAVLSIKGHDRIFVPL